MISDCGNRIPERRSDFGQRISDTGKMIKEEFLKRTLNFGLRVIRLVQSLPKNQVAAVRGKSRADFISKMGNVEEECDEALYWMEMLIESGSVKRKPLQALIDEGDEILAIVVASIKTARRNK